ncbi:MAG: aspartate kinase [Planctomycetes bacterium]|nr:aspartate kinase [Planctomycetota bacterium]
MSIVVMKFGGTSVAGADKIRAVARRVIRTQKAGYQVAIVLSAMGKTTDDLEALASEVTRGKPGPKREMDQLLSTGEQITISLMAMALENMGSSAISFTAGQIGLITDDKHTKARIKTIAVERIHRELDARRIVIVAGFQGVTKSGAITTLGRGGSNVTLVALAAALKADLCENYTDVDGVFTADPNIVPNARKIKAISYDEMLELSSLGAGVLHNRAVEFAKRYNVPIHVRNSNNNKKGTMIVAETEAMERSVVSGAALKDKLARISLRHAPNKPGVVAKIFHTIATHGIVVDDIIQTVNDDKTASVSFTIDAADLADAKRVCIGLAESLKCEVLYESHLAKVSVVGMGMRTHTGVAEKMFQALADARVNIQNITTSEIKISCLIDRSKAKRALRTIHDAFELAGRRPKAHKKGKKTKRTTKGEKTSGKVKK